MQTLGADLIFLLVFGAVGLAIIVSAMITLAISEGIAGMKSRSPSLGTLGSLILDARTNNCPGQCACPLHDFFRSSSERRLVLITLGCLYRPRGVRFKAIAKQRFGDDVARLLGIRLDLHSQLPNENP